MRPILNGYGVTGAFVVNALLWNAHCKSHYATLNQLKQERSTEAVALKLLCSQPSSKVSCDRQWHFQKPAQSTGQCKVNAISLSQVTLYFKFIMYYACSLFSSIYLQ